MIYRKPLTSQNKNQKDPPNPTGMLSVIGNGIITQARQTVTEDEFWHEENGVRIGLVMRGRGSREKNDRAVIVYCVLSIDDGLRQ